jgi:hypothetical protein
VVYDWTIGSCRRLLDGVVEVASILGKSSRTIGQSADGCYGMGMPSIRGVVASSPGTNAQAQA